MSPKAQTRREASKLPLKTASLPAPRGARGVDMAPVCGLVAYEDSAERFAEEIQAGQSKRKAS